MSQDYLGITSIDCPDPVAPGGDLAIAFSGVAGEDIDSATKVLEALADSELEGRKLLLRYDRVVPPAASSE